MATAYQICYPVTWHNDDPATPALIIPLFYDMGLGEEQTEKTLKARVATYAYCFKELREWGLETPMTMGDMMDRAGPFYDGYLECLEHGGN